MAKEWYGGEGSKPISPIEVDIACAPCGINFQQSFADTEIQDTESSFTATEVNTSTEGLVVTETFFQKKPEVPKKEKGSGLTSVPSGNVTPVTCAPFGHAVSVTTSGPCGAAVGAQSPGMLGEKGSLNFTESEGTAKKPEEFDMTLDDTLQKLHTQDRTIIAYCTTEDNILIL